MNPVGPEPAGSSGVGSLPIVVAEPDRLPEYVCDQLARLGPVITGPFVRRDLIEAVGRAAVLMVRLRHMIDKEVLDAAPRLRVVVSATTGLNHINVAECERRGIAIISTRGERSLLSTITGTAGLALALLLDLARHIVPAHADVLAGRWRRDAFRGLSLRGMTLGIIGFGRLGELMAGYGEALGMRVLASDPEPVAVPDFVSLVGLDELLERSDAISLHASHREGSPAVLGAPEFARMKNGVLIVNTARGELVDEAALLEHLESGKVGGAATDVLNDEANCLDLRSHPLVQYASRRSNLVITPHIGGATVDGLERTEVFVVAKLLRHFGLQMRDSLA